MYIYIYMTVRGNAVFTEVMFILCCASIAPELRVYCAHQCFVTFFDGFAAVSFCLSVALLSLTIAPAPARSRSPSLAPAGSRSLALAPARSSLWKSQTNGRASQMIARKFNSILRRYCARQFFATFFDSFADASFCVGCAFVAHSRSRSLSLPLAPARPR